MRPEDELDALLSDSTQAQRASRELRPLLNVAARFAPLREAAPDRAFADDLEAQLMAHMAQRAVTQPVRAIPPAPPARRLSHISPRVGWAATAAALLLTIGLGALTAKASPGAPLYVVRQFAQTLAAQALSTPTADPNVALARAQADLAAFQTANASGNEAATLAALSRLRADDALASRQTVAISDTATRQSVQAKISAFRTSAQADLRASLAWLGWQSRAKVTDVLRDWGDTSLLVSEIDIQSDSSSGDSGGQKPANNSTTLIYVHGTGFTSGTQLLLNGAPIGVRVSLTDTQLVMRVPATALNSQESHNLALAVANPDGTVAIARDSKRDDHGSSSASATPGSTDQGGDHGGSSGSTGGSPDATATANAEATASPNSSGTPER
jgi:hypothetical protein